MLNIKSDIVGSSLRPAQVRAVRAQFVSGETSLADLRRVEGTAIAELIAKEVAHDLKFVTDGKYWRRWWHLDWPKEFEGSTTQHLEKERNGVVNHIESGYINGKISYNAERAHAEIEALDFSAQEAKKYPGVTAKKCTFGPNMILADNYPQMGTKEVPYYGSNIDALIEDIALAYRCAIQDLYVHGCRYLQIDDISWIYVIDENFLKRVPPLGYEKAKALEWFKCVFTKVLEGKPADVVITNHFRKDNFRGYPLFNGFYDSVASIISQIPHDGLFVEYDDERSGSFASWLVLKGIGVTFVASLISIRNPVLESYNDIRRRYLETKAVAGGNVALSPQCGFASVEEGNCIDEETQWKKIGLFVSRRDFS